MELTKEQRDAFSRALSWAATLRDAGQTSKALESILATPPVDGDDEEWIKERLHAYWPGIDAGLRAAIARGAAKTAARLAEVERERDAAVGRAKAAEKQVDRLGGYREVDSEEYQLVHKLLDDAGVAKETKPERVRALIAERDALRAEVERLRKERDAAKVEREQIIAALVDAESRAKSSDATLRDCLRAQPPDLALLVAFGIAEIANAADAQEVRASDETILTRARKIVALTKDGAR